MKKYTIANLNIKVSGIDDTYFNSRMTDYSASKDYTKPDININYEDSNNIVLPKHKVIANVNQRIWGMTDDGKYINYDFLPEFGRKFSLITADKAWQEVDIKLYDIEPILNIPLSIRRLNAIGEVFRFALLHHNGLVIHSSSIDYDGNGILFSAPSGTGKSTHTALWKKYYTDKTTIINDDSPAIRFIGEESFIFGTPWSGKTSINCNKKAPLKAIVFMQQAEDNSIREINGIEILSHLMNEIRIPVFKEMMSLNLEIIDKLLYNVPVYLLHCNVSREAVDLVRDTMGFTN